MQPSEKSLSLRREKPARAVCERCAGTGLVIREMVFRACLCYAGRVAAANPASSVGREIHPEDYAAVMA